MKNARASSPIVAGLLWAGLVIASTTALAGPQWKWRDASGAIQYSDRPPPAGTPDSAILSRPSGTRMATPKPPEAASAAASAPPTKVTDPELEARRKKAEDEEKARIKAEEDKAAKARAENCQRAKGYQRTLQDGIRIVRTNPKGEREVLDDQGRAEEMRRTQEMIQSSCK